MKYVNEFLQLNNYSTLVKNALNKAYVNPCIVRRIVAIYEDSRFKLKDKYNPYLKETRLYNIDAETAMILSQYYKYVDKQEEKLLKEYFLTHSELSCYAGTRLLLPKTDFAQ